MKPPKLNPNSCKIMGLVGYRLNLLNMKISSKIDLKRRLPSPKILILVSISIFCIHVP